MNELIDVEVLFANEKPEPITRQSLVDWLNDSETSVELTKRTAALRAFDKMSRSAQLARTVSRFAWRDAKNAVQRREYLRIRKEAMQDARYWKKEICK